MVQGIFGIWDLLVLVVEKGFHLRVRNGGFVGDSKLWGSVGEALPQKMISRFDFGIIVGGIVVSWCTPYDQSFQTKHKALQHILTCGPKIRV